MTAEAIANGLLMDSEKPSKKPSNLTVFPKKGSKKGSDLTFSEENGQQDTANSTVPEFHSAIVREVYGLLIRNKRAKYAWLADQSGVSEATIKRAIAELKRSGYINSEHAKVNGEWQLLK